MERFREKIVLLVIGILVSSFVMEGQCDDVTEEEPQYIVFPKAFFSSNADYVKEFLSSGVSTDVTDEKMTSSQEQPLSSSSDEFTTRFDVEETTGSVSSPGISTTSVTDVTDEKMTSSQEQPLSSSSDEFTTRFDVEKTTGAVSSPGISTTSVTDVVPDHMKTSFQDPKLSPSDGESTPSLSVDEITNKLSTSGVPIETITENNATEQTMKSNSNSPTAALSDGTKTRHDANDTTRAASCPLPPTPAITRGDVDWYLWNTSYYTFVITPTMTWEKAMNKCSSFCEGAHLVFIESEQENREVSRLALEMSCLEKRHWWIGLNDKDDEGRWKWNDSPVSYTNWRNGEPNGNRSENCGEFRKWSGDKALWNDLSCGSNNQFICEVNA